MSAMDATTFKQLIAGGEFEKIERATVSGEVSFRGEKMPSSLRLLHVTFLGPVDFSDCHIAGTLDLTGCWCVRTLRLSNATIDGNLVMDDVVVEATARGARAGGYDWTHVDNVVAATGLTVHGVLAASFLTVMGDVNFSQCRIDGSVQLSGFEIRGTFYTSGAQIGGDYFLASAFRSQEIVNGFIAGSLESPNIKVAGNVSIAGIQVGASCNFWSMTVEGNFWAGYQTFAADKVAQSIVHADMHLGASMIRGHVEFEGIQVDGALKLYSSDIGPLNIRSRNTSDAGDFRYRGCRLGAIQAQGTKVRGSISLNSLEVTGSGSGSNHGVNLSNANIEGNVRFWSPDQLLSEDEYVSNVSEPPEDIGCNIVGDVDLSGARISGECNLTNILVDGTVRLEDADVRGELAFYSAVSLLDRLETQERFGDLFDRLLQNVAGEGNKAPIASIRRLAVATMRCHNDVDLTGLKLRATPPEVEAYSGYGNIDARDIQVTGHLWQFRRIGLEKWHKMAGKHGVAAEPPSADAEVPGSADYSGAKISHLSISGKSFQTPVEKGKDPARVEEMRGLRLAGAELNELEIEPLPDSVYVFPVPLNLAEIQVKIWNIKEVDGNRLERYMALLASDVKFRRSTFMAVEASLRNRGHEKDADAVYRQMTRRAYGEKPHRSIFRLLQELLMTAAVPLQPVIRFLRWLLWDKLLGFGTAPLRIGAAILIFFVVSVVGVYLDPQNIGPTTSVELANKGGPDRPPEWNMWDAIAIGLRTHVPIASWGVRDGWQLADGENRHLFIAKQEVKFMRPEDFGMLMMIFNFLAWPPFLAFALKRAFRFA